MKKTYETPTVEVIRFDARDIITASPGYDFGNTLEEIITNNP